LTENVRTFKTSLKCVSSMKVEIIIIVEPFLYVISMELWLYRRNVLACT